MKKSLLLIILWISTLLGCSDSQAPYSSETDAYNALYSLNQGLHPQPESELKFWPFTPEYLEQRHLVYAKINGLDLTPAEQQELNYLIIAERFPERFFAWPAFVPVIENSIANQAAESQQIAWLGFVQKQLAEARKSDLKLNKLELASLKKQLNELLASTVITPKLQQALTRFNDYLASYQPRGSIGLDGLANGSSWHQSKLNYFSGITLPPLEWLTVIQAQLKNMPASQLTFSFELNHEVSVAEQLIVTDNTPSGFDWQQGYFNLREHALNTSLTAPEQQFWLTLMETDIGVHYHRWSKSQALLNLKKRLRVDDNTANYLLEDIIFYPGMSFIFARYTSTNN